MNSPFYKTGGFPEIKEENKGKFTAWVKKICQDLLHVERLVK